MEQDLNLNEIHTDLISDYLRFSKYQLSQRLKSIDYCFSSLINCRVRDTETYTGEEVKTLLKDLQDVVQGETETELGDAIHTNALLVKELLSQAEEWHLTLTANVGDLENREKLSTVRLFDEKQSSSNHQKMNITVTQTKQIIPVEDMNVATALKQEIARLKADNDLLRSQINDFENQILNKPKESDDTTTTATAETISKLVSDLEEAQEKIEILQKRLSSSEVNQGSESKLKVVQEAVENLSKELEHSKTTAEEQNKKLRKDLEARESKLRQVQSNLLLAEKELDKKFQATSAYINMKKILMQKNSKIKTLRKKLESLGEVEDEETEDVDGKGEKAGFHI